MKALQRRDSRKHIATLESLHQIQLITFLVQNSQTVNLFFALYILQFTITSQSVLWRILNW